MSAFKKILLLFFLTLPGLTHAQQECLEKLQRAAAYYDAGKFQQAAILATECTQSVAETERWQAYRLLALVHVAMQNTAAAKEDAIQMLQINPTYKPSVLRDPPELVRLMKDITVIPNFSLGLAISLGSNLTLPQVYKIYKVSDYEKTYHSQNNIQLSLSAGYQFSPKWAMDASLMIMQKGYTIDYSMTNWNLTSGERFTYLTLPVSARYYFNNGSRIQPYVQAGLYGGMLLFSNQSLNAEYTPTSKTFELSNFSSTERRNSFDAGLNLGVGVNYHVANGRWFAGVNYMQGFSNITKTSARYQFNDLIYTYYYIDDDIRLSNFAFSLGYALNISYRVYQKGGAK